MIGKIVFIKSAKIFCNLLLMTKESNISYKWVLCCVTTIMFLAVFHYQYKLSLGWAQFYLYNKLKKLYHE